MTIVPDSYVSHKQRRVILKIKTVSDGCSLNQEQEQEQEQELLPKIRSRSRSKGSIQPQMIISSVTDMSK